jgi:large subunit ribosomal protein L6
MSKIAKKPITIPDGAEAKVDGRVLRIKGKEGELNLNVLEYVSIEVKEGHIIFTATANHKQARANWGTMAALTKNAFVGVTKGFIKNLEFEGIGFRASLEGVNLVLSVGFTHPVKIAPPAGIKFSIEKNVIKISGADKTAVGQVAAQIRKVKPPEPYLGKGIRYQGEVIQRKAGKKAAGATGAAA